MLVAQSVVCVKTASPLKRNPLAGLFANKGVEMKWFIEDKDGSTVFESMSYQKAFDEWNRLCDTDGWWSLYREDDTDEPWCAGGLEELQPANIVRTRLMTV